MTRIYIITIYLAASTAVIHAQLDLLTIRESESLVEHVPAVADGIAQGGCPTLSPTYGDQDRLGVQVRFACGAKAGQLLSNYVVNRRTGALTSGLDEDLSHIVPETAAFAAALVARAIQRKLSPAESTCLALEAARGIPGWEGKAASITVEPFGKPTMRNREFTARRRSSDPPIECGRMLNVDTAQVRVRDDETGRYLMSAGLGSLVEKMIMLREPIGLSELDVIDIVGQLPSLTAKLLPGCLLSTGGVFRSDERQVGLLCGGSLTQVTSAVSVNIFSGRLKDLESGHYLASAEAAESSRLHLHQAEQRRSDLQRDVDALCAVK